MSPGRGDGLWNAEPWHLSLWSGIPCASSLPGEGLGVPPVLCSPLCSHLQQGQVSPSPTTTSSGKVMEWSSVGLEITIIILVCSLGGSSLQAGPLGRGRGIAFQNMTPVSPRPSFNDNNDNNKLCSLGAAFLLQHLPPVALHFPLAV